MGSFSFEEKKKLIDLSEWRVSIVARFPRVKWGAQCHGMDGSVGTG